MKSTLLQFTLSTLFLLIGIMGFAQEVQNVCVGSTSTYTVDEEDGPNGTPDSTYTWSVLPATASGYTINDISGNSISINWGTTPVGQYTVQVIETTEDGDCAGDPQILFINVLPEPEPVTVDLLETPICLDEDSDVQFIIQGEEGTTVFFTVTHTTLGNNPVVTTETFTDTNQVIGTEGTYTHTVLNPQPGVYTLTVTTVTVGECSLLIEEEENPTATINVNPIPVTGPIVPSAPAP
ncbi:MAG: hypothetical protein Q4F57_07000 [Weeksellaceae bacterium]|nr:hypothetical protein [Weeksellaceae bacterium]